MWRFLIILAALVSIPPQHDSVQAVLGAQILYVDDDAPAGGDGLQWASAFHFLQDALDAARRMPAIKEIRVAQGTYLPDHGINVKIGDQHAEFRIVSGTAL